jgi:hypothetical protein
MCVSCGRRDAAVAWAHESRSSLLPTGVGLCRRCLVAFPHQRRVTTDASRAGGGPGGGPGGHSNIGTIRTFFKPNDGEAFFRRQLRRSPRP